MGNNRGSMYSNRHDRDGEWSIRERWNFNFADMGYYDMPAQVDKVLEVTNKPKVTIIGFSQGSAQSIYGLAKRQDFFAPRVHRFVALAPCIKALRLMTEPYTNLSQRFKEELENGILF
mmetsp:Transcript_44395/g.58895  ORF Transcript_44395/g.58895 Transcript_44395/m.58895 type:complete len:118 (-) Transcript_44395:363-716(-)